VCPSPFLVLPIVLLAFVSNAMGQDLPPRAETIRQTEEYRRLLEGLLPLQESALSTAERALEKRQQMYADGLISRLDLEGGETAVQEARRKLGETRRQIAESGNLIAELQLARELEEKHKAEVQEKVIFFAAKSPLPEAWMTKVEDFFAVRFGAPLPVSAVGQTAVHTRLGFVHQDAMDVALHPDSPEGAALMEYLRGKGISFIAFRDALAGSATGAHIHVGKPSVRVPPALLENTSSQ